MRIDFSERAWAQYQSWAAEPRTLQRLNRLIEAAARDPGGGIGTPERLAGNLSGYWSRRITSEHRLVYTVSGENLTIVQVRYHYS